MFCFTVHKNLDRTEEDLPIKCAEPRPLTHEPKRSNEKGNTVEINFSASEVILKEVIRERRHTLADQGGNITIYFSLNKLPSALLY